MQENSNGLVPTLLSEYFILEYHESIDDPRALEMIKKESSETQWHMLSHFTDYINRSTNPQWRVEQFLKSIGENSRLTAQAAASPDLNTLSKLVLDANSIVENNGNINDFIEALPNMVCRSMDIRRLAVLDDFENLDLSTIKEIGQKYSDQTSGISRDVRESACSNLRVDYENRIPRSPQTLDSGVFLNSSIDLKSHLDLMNLYRIGEIKIPLKRGKVMYDSLKQVNHIIMIQCMVKSILKASIDKTIQTDEARIVKTHWYKSQNNQELRTDELYFDIFPIMGLTEYIVEKSIAYGEPPKKIVKGSEYKVLKKLLAEETTMNVARLF